MLEPSLIIAVAVVVLVLVLTSVIVTTFLRSVDAGEILLASRGGNLQIYRGPCKALIVPVITQIRLIPAQAINVDIEITDQTADVDANGRSAPVKVTVRASAIVSVGEDESDGEHGRQQVLLQAGRRAALDADRRALVGRPPRHQPPQARSALQRARPTAADASAALATAASDGAGRPSAARTTSSP